MGLVDESKGKGTAWWRVIAKGRGWMGSRSRLGLCVLGGLELGMKLKAACSATKGAGVRARGGTWQFNQEGTVTAHTRTSVHKHTVLGWECEQCLVKVKVKVN